MVLCLQAVSFDGSGSPVLAIKGCRLSDWGGQCVQSVVNCAGLIAQSMCIHKAVAFNPLSTFSTT